MSTPMETVRQFYMNFAARNFPAMGERLAAKVWYIGPDGDVREKRDVEGKAGALAAFRFWHDHIQLHAIRHVHIAVASHRKLAEDARARICLTVTYEMSGICTDATGLRDMRVGGKYTLSVADVVWLDQRNQVVRIVSRVRMGD